MLVKGFKVWVFGLIWLTTKAFAVDAEHVITSSGQDKTVAADDEEEKYLDESR